MVRSTIDVVWHEDRGVWTVEGGNGQTAVLGIVSLHERREDALQNARELADCHEAEIRIIEEPISTANRSGQ